MYAPWSLSARRCTGLRRGLRRVPRGDAPLTDPVAARADPRLWKAWARFRKAVLTEWNCRAAAFQHSMGAPRGLTRSPPIAGLQNSNPPYLLRSYQTMEPPPIGFYAAAG